MKGKFIFSFSFAFVLMISSTAYAGYYGPPEPLARDGNFSLGVGYSYFSDEYKVKSSSEKFKFMQNEVYVQLNAFYRCIEFYGRVGGADLRVDNAFVTSLSGVDLKGFKSDFKDDTYKAFATVGAKGSWQFAPQFSLGPFFQASYFTEYSDETKGTINGIPVTQKLEIGGSYKVDFGLFLQAKVKPVIFYAGPFIYLVRGDVKSTVTATLPGLQPLSATGTDKFEEKGNFGGAAGLRINLVGGLNLELEAQYRQQFSAGGLISYSF